MAYTSAMASTAISSPLRNGFAASIGLHGIAVRAFGQTKAADEKFVFLPAACRAGEGLGGGGARVVRAGPPDDGRVVRGVGLT